MREAKSPLLLVGEAGFAFASAFAIARPEMTFLATCYQTEQTTLELHPDVVENLRKIAVGAPKHRFAFGVDATKLETYDAVTSLRPKTILFNFPHVGGKSNIKKNRRLLKEFFCSCSMLFELEEEAEEETRKTREIWVTLLNGQGGTSADSPRREWANSWQITAMAAEGGFILRRCFPFDETSFPGYVRTGFRGRDQSFQGQAGAIVHVFEKGLAAPLVPTRVSIMTVVPHPIVENESSPGYLPAHICRRLESIVRWSSRHPLRRVLDPLLNSSLIPGESFAKKIPPFLTLDDVTKNFLSDKEYFVLAHQEDIPLEDGNSKLFLRSTVFQNALEDFAIEKWRPCYHGDCYRKASLDNLNAFSYELLFLSETEESLSQLLQSNQSCFLRNDFSNKSHELFTVFPPALESIIELERVYHGVPEVERFFGCEGRLDAGNSIKKKLYFAWVNVLELTSIVFQVEDSRLFWTRDERLERDAEQCRLLSVSLHPPLWTHCMSFWEPSSFDEEAFINVVLDFAEDLLSRVELVERYTDKKGRASRCYQFTYECLDRPLTKARCSSLQCSLRLIVEKALGVELR